MKKKFLALAIASALLLAACSNSSGDDNTTTPENEAVTSAADAENESTTAASTEQIVYNTTAAIAEGFSEEDAYQLMVENSLMTKGNESRMVKVLQKAAAGEEITIGFIGGSITEGVGGTSEVCYAYITYQKLCEMFPDTKINYVNAGLSGTPSVLGIARAERDLFSGAAPDIIFIEFAVNNGGERVYKETYESLIVKSLQKENQPAVVLLFTVLKNGYTSEDWMAEIGSHYALPMISVRNAIQPMFDAERLTWEDYSDDESHPNYWGHAMVADLNGYLFEQVKADIDSGAFEDEGYTIPEPMISADYADMTLLDSLTLTEDSADGFKQQTAGIAAFPNSWLHRSGSGENKISFTMEFRNLFLIFTSQNSEKFGTVDVYVDGELAATVNSNMASGWGAPETAVIANGTENASHTVEIRMAEGFEDNYFAILGFGICN